jgi:hypothetical protein
VLKRPQRQGLLQPPRPPEPTPVEQHSGEGAASVLEMLQKQEQRRVPEKPPDGGD